jgi:hypothetical protein
MNIFCLECGETSREWLSNTFSGDEFKKVEIKKEKSKVTKAVDKYQSWPTTPDDGVSDSPAIFTCPNEGCVKVYQSYGKLSWHTEYGKCEYKAEKESLLDKAKVLYTKSLLTDSNLNLPDKEKSGVQDDTVPCIPNTSLQGWALLLTRKKKRFTKKQKEFLDEKFQLGEQTGKKFDPLQVSLAMRVAKDNEGEHIFCVEEFLSEEQIKGYFSRCTSKRKINHFIDDERKQAAAVAEEELLSDMRELVNKNIQISHPIMIDNHNMCDLVKNDKLTSLGIPLLRSICETFDLKLADGYSGKRKAPFVALLKEFAATCSCMSHG